MMKKLMGLGLVALAASMAVPASAAVVTLDFEGIADGAAIGNYYNGGGGGNLGVTFSAGALALIDADAGGNGNFANEPSANTIMFFTGSATPILNYSAGFTTGFSFWYTSSTAATITVYDGLNGTGNVLGTINVAAQNTANNCQGDPSGGFCNWTNVGVAFTGTAKSINFGGTANQTGYDNITFGSDRATGGVPEPATWAMMIGGFGAIGVAARRRRKVNVSFA